MKNCTIKIGDTFRKVVTLTYYDTGNPVNLTGVTAYADIKVDAKPTTPVTASAVCTVEAALGRITAEWAAEDTAVIQPGQYVYDIRIVDEDDVKTIFGGPLTFDYAVTDIPGGE